MIELRTGIKVIYEIKCGVCQDLHQQEWVLYEGQNIPPPMIPPPTWSKVGTVCFCPKHKVCIKYEVTEI